MSHDTKRFRLNRRRFLTGLGSMVALPTLGSLVGGGRWGRAHAGDEWPTRMIIFTFPNGAMMGDFTPASAGSNWALPPSLAGFEGHRDRITVVTGLSNLSSVRALYDEGDLNHHPLGASALLTGGKPPITGPLAQPVATEGRTKYVVSAGGPSVDQVAAAAFQGDTPFSSLLVTAEIQPISVPTSRYSWSDVNSPCSVLGNAKQLFDYLFTDLSIDPTEQAKLTAMRTSVLDAVSDSIESTRAQLGSEDRHRLDEHLTAVRELELRASGGGACSVPTDPGTSDAYAGSALIRERTEVLMQLSAKALECDLTRVLVFSMGESGAGVPVDWMRLGNNDHGLSHFTEATRADYATVATWKLEQFARFLEILDGIPEGDGTVLDHSAIVCCSEFSNGGTHVLEMLPVLVAGGAGNMTGGKHMVVPCSPTRRALAPYPNLAPYASSGDTPMANLWLTMLNAVGVQTDSFGESTDMLSGLWLG